MPPVIRGYSTGDVRKVGSTSAVIRQTTSQNRPIPETPPNSTTPPPEPQTLRPRYPVSDSPTRGWFLRRTTEEHEANEIIIRGSAPGVAWCWYFRTAGA